MRRNTEIQVYGETEVLRQVEEFIKSDVISIRLDGSPLYIELYEDTSGFKKLIEELERRGLKYRRLEVREYTKQEINTAEFFYMEIIYPWESDGTSADEYGTKYEKDCSNCSCSKKQTSNLLIDKKKMGKYDIATIQPEIIVNEKLCKVLTDNNITGYELRPVVDYKGKLEPVLYQLAIKNILPEMSKEIRTEIEENVYCKECKRNGVFLRSEAVYEKGSLKNACDFNLTQEYFGMNLYCKQYIIVSSKVFNLFKKNKIKRVAFEPVRISNL